MKSLFPFCILIFCLLGHSDLFAQSFGKITFSYTTKIDMSQVRIVSISSVDDGSGTPMAVDIQGAEEGGGGPNMDIPEVLTGEKILSFVNQQGRIDDSRSMMNIRTSTRIGGGAGEAPKVDEKEEEVTSLIIESVHMDWKSRSYKDVIRSGDPKETASFYKERKFKDQPQWKLSKKTRKILGFSCHKATCTFKNEPYTIWYTDEIPLHFSPVADLFPPTGFVLAIESDVESWEAKAADMTSPVDASQVTIPTGSILLANEEAYDKIRQKFIEQNMNKMQFNLGGH